MSNNKIQNTRQRERDEDRVQPGEPETVVVIGSTGLIGSAVVEQFEAEAGGTRYQVIGATQTTEPALDLEDPASIAAFFDEVGPVHHVVVAAGDAHFGDFDSLNEETLGLGIRSKLLGQVHVALQALPRLPGGGSVTLTSGALSHTPIPGSSAVAMVNGALDSFVRAIDLDTPAGRRINVVSPGWIKETMERMGLDPTPGTSVRNVARLYLDAVQSDVSGRVLENRRGEGGHKARARLRT